MTTGRRRRVPEGKTIRRRAGLLLGAGVVLAGAGVAAGVTLWPSDGAGKSGTASSAATTTAEASDRTRPPTTAASQGSPTPSPTRSYPLSKAPQTIPAVRDHTAARGPGWRPAKGARVVVDDKALADEGKLLAGELGMTYAGEGTAGGGDVELGLTASGGDAESYAMTVSGGRVRITGPGEAGVFYGTRTLKQEVHGGGTAPEGVVRDGPAKHRRGFMLDIARKYFTEGWIEDRIRELGDLKYNELGLHFSDDQGFRIESSTHPEVVSSQHLTKAQLKRIVALAASRHITVVPEIDSPGHLGAALSPHPDLRLRTAGGTVISGAVDISKSGSATLVDDLLKEYAGLFPGSYWNLGGDEYTALTSSNPSATYPQLATAATREYGAGAGVADLATGWLNDRAAVLKGRMLRAWNDGFYKAAKVVAPSSSLEVAYWTGKELGARPPTDYLTAGRKVVNYNDEYLYYVLGEPNTFVYPTGRRIYEQWTPRVLRGTTAVSARYDAQIEGGVFAVWCDRSTAQTEAQVAAGVRMPLAAMAQKVWDAGAPGLSWAGEG
ncbi:Glycoside hydrolase, family 20, catalytic core, partial [Actinobacteria bacterium OK074]